MRITQRYIFQPAFFICQLLFLFSASPVLAIQAHGSPEGLYAHQIGHLLFGLAMVGFAVRILISKLTEEKSWQWMAIGALMLACWNGWAFVAHFLEEAIPLANFQLNGKGVKVGLWMNSPIEWFYYLFKMDHLVSIPALLFIYLALRRMNGHSSTLASEETTK